MRIPYSTKFSYLKFIRNFCNYCSPTKFRCFYWISTIHKHRDAKCEISLFTTATGLLKYFFTQVGFCSKTNTNFYATKFGAVRYVHYISLPSCLKLQCFIVQSLFFRPCGFWYVIPSYKSGMPFLLLSPVQVNQHNIEIFVEADVFNPYVQMRIS